MTLWNEQDYPFDTMSWALCDIMLPWTVFLPGFCDPGYTLYSEQIITVIKMTKL